jgi:uncharacterized protein YvpB
MKFSYFEKQFMRICLMILIVIIICSLAISNYYICIIQKNTIYVNKIVEQIDQLNYEIGQTIQNDNQTYNNACNCFNNLDNNLNLVNSDSISECQRITDNLLTNDRKNNLITSLNNLSYYNEINNNIINFYDDKQQLKATVSYQSYNEVLNKVNNCTPKYQSPLKLKLTDVKNELNNITDLDMQINSLYSDSNLTIVKDNITNNDYQKAISLYNNVKETYVKDKYEKPLSNVNTKLKEIAAAKRAAEKKRQDEIAAAWVQLNVPYISQNQNQVYEGCEAASLLMALQYKGYLLNMDLLTFANNMPKSSDPNTGFTYSIFDVNPKTVSHYINPEPLANYGKLSSGYLKVYNTTGTSLNDLDNEIDNNNPVLIYVTGAFKEPAEWVEGTPINQHVLLLIGYNKITHDQILQDPWTWSWGYIWHKDFNSINDLYTSLGSRSVTVR